MQLSFIILCSILFVFEFFSNSHGVVNDFETVSTLRQQQQQRQSQTVRKGCRPLPNSCRDQACFLIKITTPHHIFPPENRWNRSVFEDGKGFDCVRYRDYGFEGLFFELLDDFWDNSTAQSPPKNYQCFIVPDTCPWSATYNFTAESRDADDNKIVFFSSLIETAERRKLGAIATTPIIADNLVIVGLRRLGETLNWRLIFEPFDKRTWMTSGISTLILIFTALLSYWNNPQRRLRRVTQDANPHHSWKESSLNMAERIFRFLRRDFGDDGGEEQESTETSEITQSRKPLKAWHRFGNAVLFLAFATHFFFFVMLYEAALTNFLFRDAEIKLSKPVLEMNDDALEDFIVLGDSAVHDVFTALQRNNKKRTSTQPWDKCRTYGECFDALTKGTHKYSVVEETVAKYVIKTRELCDEIAILTEPRPLHTFDTVLYFSPNTDPKLRKKIDDRIMFQHISGRDQFVGGKFKSACSLAKNNIQFEVVLAVMAFTVAIIGAIIVVLLIRIIKLFERAHRKGPRRREERDEQDSSAV